MKKNLNHTSDKDNGIFAFENIEAYVNDEMSSEMLKTFEKALGNAPQEVLDLIEGLQLQKLAEAFSTASNPELNQGLDNERIIRNIPSELLKKNIDKQVFIKKKL